MRKKLLFLLLVLIGGFSSVSRAQTIYPNAYFKDGDKVNFIGNSITHGGQFHNYLMLYYATRFPDQKVIFYNSGIWGENANNFLRRMDADILSKPTDYAVVMTGMNDVNRALYHPDVQSETDIEARKERALSDMKMYLERVIVKLEEANATVILLKPTIYDETGTLTGANMPGVNEALRKATLIIDELATKYDLKTVDFYTIMNTINTELQAANPSATVVSNDRIHPGAPGHLVMAYQFLKETEAPKYVSNTEIANGVVTTCVNCTTRDVTSAEGSLEFKHKAESLPFPVDPAAKAALEWVPFSNEFNMERLQVSGLAAGKYNLTIDGKWAGEFTQEQLEAGVNLALVQNTPQYKQAEQVRTQTSLYRTVQMNLRDLKRVEYSYLPGELLGAPFSEIEAHINTMISNNDSKYTSNRALFDKYLVNKPNEQALEDQLVTIAEHITTINKPVERTYSISKTTQSTTHIWDFDEDVAGKQVEGWTINKYEASTEGGILKLYGTESYNNMIYYAMTPNPWAGTIDPTVSKTLVFKMKNETSFARAVFYFDTREPTANYQKIAFDIVPNDTEFREYTVDLTDFPSWKGKIYNIRLDIPASMPAGKIESDKAISIDYIKLLAAPDVLSSVKEDAFSGKQLVYPNPTNGEVNVSLDKNYAAISVEVLDALGRSVFRDSVKATDRVNVNLKSLKSGIFLIRIAAGDQHSVLRIIKQ